MARPIGFVKNLLSRLTVLVGLCFFPHVHAEILDGRLSFEAQISQSTCLLSSDNDDGPPPTRITFSLNTEKGKRMCMNSNNLKISVDSPQRQMSELNDRWYLANTFGSEAFTLQSVQRSGMKPMHAFEAKLALLVDYQ